MPATAALALALIVGVGLIVLAGVTPLIGIPMAALVFLVPVASAAFAARAAQDDTKLDQATPTTREATYDPVVDPSDRP
jgi:ABC-type transport system involved in cytochrome bd biosynthesis fused ATPase/permease subunit